MRKRLLSIAIIMTMIITLSASAAFAASTKQMTVYDDVIKKKSTVYCSAGNSIYKVNLKNSKVKVLRRNAYAHSMKLYKGYIYYCMGGDVNSTLHRIKTNGSRKKHIHVINMDKNYEKYVYVIKGSTIYFYNSNHKVYKMNLSGKNTKKATNVKIKMKTKKSNIKGYKIANRYVYSDETDWGAEIKYYKYYLKKPNGKKIYLGTEGESYY